MRSRYLTPVGDLLAILVFSLVGTASHKEGNLGVALVRNVVPFGVAWLVFATALGLYRALPSLASPEVPFADSGLRLGLQHSWRGREWMGHMGWRLLIAGVLAGVVGAALRSWWFDRPYEGDFVAVATVFLTLFVGAWLVGMMVWLRPMTSSH